MGGYKVMSTESERLLGMTLEHHLSWTPHIRGETWRQSGDNEPGVVSKLTRKVTAVKRLMSMQINGWWEEGGAMKDI